MRRSGPHVRWRRAFLLRRVLRSGGAGEPRFAFNMERPHHLRPLHFCARPIYLFAGVVGRVECIIEAARRGDIQAFVQDVGPDQAAR